MARKRQLASQVLGEQVACFRGNTPIEQAGIMAAFVRDVRNHLVAVMVFVVALLKVQAAPATPAEFPFQFREGLLWVEVTTPQSAKPLNFLLDTGAEVSVINLNTAKRLGLTLGPKVSVRGVQTTTTGYWPQRVGASAGNVTLPSEFLVLDLSKLSSSCAQPVDGLIGADFFRNRIVQIDFVKQKIRPSTTCDLSTEAESLPLEIRPCGMCVDASVNGGKPQRLRIDTGCATALQWVTSRVRPQDCSRKVAIGLAQLSIPQTRTTLKLGGQTFMDVPTGVHRKAIFAGEAGLLGNDLLSRFETVTIDSRSGRLILGRLRDP
jgi:Aspartyl protease